VLRLPAAGICNFQCGHTNLDIFRSVERYHSKGLTALPILQGKCLSA